MGTQDTTQLHHPICLLLNPLQPFQGTQNSLTPPPFIHSSKDNPQPFQGTQNSLTPLHSFSPPRILHSPFKGHKIHLHHSHSFTPPRILYSPFKRHKFTYTTPIHSLLQGYSTALLRDTNSLTPLPFTHSSKDTLQPFQGTQIHLHHSHSLTPPRILHSPFKGHKIHLHHSHSFTPPRIIYSPFKGHKFTYTTPIHSLPQGYSTALSRDTISLTPLPFIHSSKDTLQPCFTTQDAINLCHSYSFLQHNFLPTLSYIDGKFSSLFIYPK